MQLTKIAALCFLVLVTISCSTERVLYRDHEAVARNAARPTAFVQQECFKEDIVGNWLLHYRRGQQETSGCMWAFKENGEIASQGESCSAVPTSYEVKRLYSDILNAYLDIYLYYKYDGRVRTTLVKSCEMSDDTMIWSWGGEGGTHSFSRIK